jgi:hypothetical protein
MSKKLLIGIGFFYFIFLGSALPAVENIKLSGDLNLQAITRDFFGIN